MAKKDLFNFITEDEFQKLLSYMPNPDLILQNNYETLKIIEEMKTDPQIFAKLEELKTKVLAKNWDIIPASQDTEDIEIANFVKEIIESNLDINNDLLEMITALEYGFSVSEVIWKQQEDSTIVPETLKGRSQMRFVFNANNQLVDLQTNKVLDMPYKFIIFRNNIVNENPYGQSILTRCYWIWKFKKLSYQFWIQLLEKFSVPSIAAITQIDTPDEKKLKEMTNQIAEELAKIDSGSSGAFGNVKDIKVLETSGNGDAFEKLINLCNNEISKAIVGSTLTSDSGNNGSYALSKIHSETIEYKANKIASNLQNCLNRTLIKWIVELNYGTNVPLPKFQFDLSTIPDWNITKDAIDRGIPVSINKIYAMYGIPKPDTENEEDIFIKQTNQQPINFSDFFFQTNKSRFRIK